MSIKKDVKQVKWDEALADARLSLIEAKAYIKRLRFAIKVFERNKNEGKPWPGESATPLRRASQRPSAKAATQ